MKYPCGMLSSIAKFILKIGGWSFNGYTPSEPKFIMLAAPHTAFIDGFWMVVGGFAFNIRPAFLVKATYIKGLLGRVILFFGDIPVVSGAKANKVAETIDMIKQKSEMKLVIAPEGTRIKRDHWRSGFYHIGRAANLPIYLSYLDFGKRELGVHPDPVHLTGNMTADMDIIRRFYAGKRGRHPEMQSPIRLRDEELVLTTDE
ncbi:MAG: acyltransferase [Chloroflexota bacterium]